MAASNTRFTQNSLGQSKTPIDSDHGIYRYSAASSSRCAAAWPHNRSRADLEAAELNAALGDSHMTHLQR